MAYRKAMSKPMTPSPKTPALLIASVIARSSARKTSLNAYCAAPGLSRFDKLAIKF
jgi:hypothetical protein